MKRISTTLIVLIASMVSSLSAQVIPLGEPEFSFLYDIHRRVTVSSLEKIDYQNGPYRYGYFIENANRYALFTEPSMDNVRLFGLVREDAAYFEHHSPIYNESSLGGILFQPHKNWTLYTGYSLNEEKANDPDYSGKKWRGLAGGVNDAFITYQSSSILLMGGRFAQFWGIRHSLVLSEKHSLDGLAVSYRWKSFSLSYRLARLDKLVSSDTAFSDNRFFAGHRLDWHISPRVRVGVFEAVIFGGVGRQIELNYLNPIIFFHADQLNDDINDNTFLGIDFTLKPITSLEIYGQLLVDDFQIEKKTQGDQEPDQYGLILGGYWRDITDKVDIEMEYTRVTNWTFNQKEARNRYLYENEPLGAVNGNDFEKLYVKAMYWYQPAVRLYAGYERIRQGEGTLFDNWNEPWLDIEGDYDETFPTGVVESTGRLFMGGTGIFAQRWFVEVESGYTNIDNFRHLTENTTDFWQFNLTISYLFTIDL